MAPILLFLGVSTILGFVLYNRLLSYLQRKHERTWIALGKPRLTPRHILTNAVGGRPSIQRFLWNQEFRALSDPRLSRRCEQLRWFIILFVFGFPIVILLGAN
jgi:hypothetical protein